MLLLLCGNLLKPLQHAEHHGHGDDADGGEGNPGVPEVREVVEHGHTEEDDEVAQSGGGEPKALADTL